MATVATQLWVCSDCLMMLANGDMPEDMPEDYQSAFLARHTAGLERELDGHYGNVVAGGAHHCGDGEAWRDGDCACEDGGFSNGECDLCRDGLAGDRYAATVIYN
jgi:hypothetical protein